MAPIYSAARIQALGRKAAEGLTLIDLEPCFRLVGISEQSPKALKASTNLVTTPLVQVDQICGFALSPVLKLVAAALGMSSNFWFVQRKSVGAPISSDATLVE
jgi:hypothetical protein